MILHTNQLQINSAGERKLLPCLVNTSFIAYAEEYVEEGFTSIDVNGMDYIVQVEFSAMKRILTGSDDQMICNINYS